MHERLKLGEARYFLDRMVAERGNHSAVSHELSAFLAAARSVLQYALDEAKATSGGQQWYDQAVADPLLRFFKGKRNATIHREPVRPLRKLSTRQAGFITVGEDEDEMMIPYPHEQTVEHYEFQDRPGEDVYDLSRRCLELLETFVDDGVAHGWITG
jgi:broad specificity phosphatase PhoE